ncbi:AAA family ATPase [Serinibacter salmoneus]|uniref:MinD-like ATPase involved in chromosome partitioning or flagellar assembly n=1 Tax=Serinibacter salmoneus TaxID=556530 RepID=A0A2A9D2Y8_9MICO|nr:hypothetical protein [Serinibacter salmoneus]PFG20322.1 MinD-like ATPase involved in chromosome partitioning or flagellar assembly [Serinibacter salmoneus]
MADRGVLLWLSGTSEPDVVASLDAAADLQVVRRCADLAELLAAAAAGLGSAAVLGLGRGVDRNRIADLRREGVAVVLVAARADAARATSLGADAVLVEAEGLDQDVVRAVRAVLQARASEGHAVSEGGRDPREEVRAEPDLTVEGAAPVRPREAAVALEGGAVSGVGAGGRVIVVWSAPGSPGRSTVAWNLAAECASLLSAQVAERPSVPERRGTATAPDPETAPDAAVGAVALVDADTFAPSLAQAAALVEDSSAIAALCRAAAQGVLDPSTIRRRRARLPEGVDLFSGLTRADRWREVGGESFGEVIEALRARYRVTVIDVAAGLEQPGLRGVDRWQATRAALGRADDIVVLVAADPIGVRRGVHALADLHETGAPGTRHVVVSKVRQSSAGRAPGEAVAGALRRFAHVEPAAEIPLGSQVDEALLRGIPLLSVAPRGAVRLAVRGLAASLLGVPEALPGRRGARRRIANRRVG